MDNVLNHHELWRREGRMAVVDLIDFRRLEQADTSAMDASGFPDTLRPVVQLPVNNHRGSADRNSSFDELGRGEQIVCSRICSRR